jgi:hypothetical protein
MSRKREDMSLPWKSPYWTRARTGDHVYDANDPRHAARLNAIHNGIAYVRFFDTGYKGEIKLDDLRQVGKRPLDKTEDSPWL